MKQIKAIFYFSLFTALYMVSCDKVDNPFPEDLTVGNAKGIIWDDSASSETDNDGIRFILFEEHTGHTCNNCPAITEKVERFKEEFSPYLIPVAVHAGDLAKPKTSGEKYQTDFRTDLGDELTKIYDPISIPRASINRISNGKEVILLDDEWRGVVEEQVGKSSIANIYVKNRYDDSTGIIQNEVIVEWIEDRSQPLNLQMVLIEDKIIDWQLDRRLPEGQQDIPDYEHNHVLRSAINGLFGQPLDILPSGSRDTIITNFELPTKIRDINNCSVVAFILKPGPQDFEVLQVNYAHVTSGK